jgi:hypothetical protein
MSSDTIYSILSSIQHNKHYLNRYIKFINSCVDKNKTNNESKLYLEKHHICPKAKDMFPQYEDAKIHAWNICKLTDRQHFIAHWLLWKTYSNQSQSYAFHCMVNNQTTSWQKREVKKINSKTYSLVKKQTNKAMSEFTKGKATYVDQHGNKIYCRTDDPRVLSGELISTTKGRTKCGPQTEESKKRHRERMRSLAFNPNKTVKLFFLHFKVFVRYHDAAFVEMLEQGWSMRETKEYRSMIAINSNKKRPSNKGKKHKPISKEIYVQRLIDNGDKMKMLFYDTKTNTFQNIYIALYLHDHDKIPDTFIRVHDSTDKKNARRIWDSAGNFKWCTNKVPTPPGFTETDPGLIKIIRRTNFSYENCPVLICPHCQLQSRAKSNMTRYHFDNCKKKLQS